MSRLVAHRGQKQTLPENSLESIAEAIACGASAVEFDVQQTADSVPVVCHDVSLKRTAAIDIDITESNYTAIKDISIGEPSRFNNQYQSLKLPSLQDMVSLLEASPQVTAFVELKDESLNALGIDTMLKPVVSVLQPIQKHCVVIADNLSALIRLKQLSSLPIGWIVHRWHKDDLTAARDARVDYMIINHKYYDRKLKYEFTKDDWSWVMYQTCDPQLALSLFNEGVSFVETSDICSMLKQIQDNV